MRKKDDEEVEVLVSRLPNTLRFASFCELLGSVILSAHWFWGLSFFGSYPANELL